METKYKVVTRCCGAGFTIGHVANGDICRACNLGMPHSMGNHLSYFTCDGCKEHCDVKNDFQVAGSPDPAMTTTPGQTRELSSAGSVREPTGTQGESRHRPAT